MGYPTTNPTLFADKTTHSWTGSAWEHPDGNVVKARVKELATRVTYSKSVKVSSKGTIVVTCPGQASPVGACMYPKNSTASAIFATTCVMTISGNYVKYKGQTNNKAGSAYVTVFFD